MLRVLEAMGILALVTREMPAAIATERKLLRTILEASATQAIAVEERMEQYASRLESRLSQLPKELETGLDPPRIAKLLGESLRQCFQRSGLPDTAKVLGQSCSEMNSAHKQLVSTLREIAHPDVGVVARIRNANETHSCEAWQFVQNRWTISLSGWKNTSGRPVCQFLRSLHDHSDSPCARALPAS